MTWHFWNGTAWSEVTEADLDTLKPSIVCGKLAGSGSLDQRVTLAVADPLSVQVAQAQHRRYRRQNRR